MKIKKKTKLMTIIIKSNKYLKKDNDKITEETIELTVNNKQSWKSKILNKKN